MSGPDLRLLPAAAAIWLGAFTATGVAARWSLSGGGLLLVSAVWAAHRSRLWLATVWVCLAAGLVATGLRVVSVEIGPVDELAAHQTRVRAVLTLTADPVWHQGTVQGSSNRGPGFTVIPARLEQVSARGRVWRTRAPVLVLAFSRGWVGLLPGQELATTARLRPPRPGEALAAVLSVRDPPRLLGRPNRLERAAGSLRAGLRRAVAGLPPDERGLVPGLVVGDVSRVPGELTADFRTTGLTHLNAVSGANLAIAIGFVVIVGRWCGVRGRWLAALGGAAMVGFVVLARPQPSVLRAAAMGAVTLAALATGRRRGGVASLAAAVIGLVLVDPWLARSYGFALSALATAGLLVLAPSWARWLHEHRWPWPVAHAVAVPTAAQVACAPVIVLLSGQLSLVAVPANLLVAPAVAPATVVGLLAALVSPLSDPVAALLGWICYAPAWWIVTVAEHGARLPLAALPWPGTVVGALGLAVALAGAVMAGRAAARFPRTAGGVAVAVVGAGTVWAGSPGWPPPGWVMVACDVGQGDALVLDVGPGTAVVVDAGPDPRLVDGCLRDLGITRVPLLLLTHFHADHVEGVPGVLRGRHVGQVEVGPYDEPAEERARVLAWTSAAHVPVRQVTMGERVVMGPLRWTVLWPARVIEEDSVPNNASIVLLLRSRGLSLLLTGDVEPPAQEALAARWGARPVDVLKVPHHGSAYQDPALIRALRPRVAVISVGADNDYGHPAPRTIRLLQATGARVERTDQDGDVAVVSGPSGLRVVTSDG
ncbi:MAG: competence protein ComEC [Actinomycetota bacterium]|nr:competence protein ComEC [Actinomycetota bacterium]